MDQARCSHCDYPLNLPGGAFPCFGCELAELCPRCATADVPLCRDCLSVQNKSLQVVAEKKTKTSPCHYCRGVYETNACITCNRWVCDPCQQHTERHPCLRCEAPWKKCMGRRAHVCCNKSWCDTCYQSHWKTCESSNCYKCVHCGKKSPNFGDESNRCPILNCYRGWGCLSCAVRRPKGLYCYLHISGTKCGICQHRYPIAGDSLGHGRLWLSFSGRRRVVLCEVCDLCMFKVKTLVDSLLWLSIKKGQRFEREVMNMIVRHAVEVLKVESSSAVLEWSKLDRWKLN